MYPFASQLPDKFVCRSCSENLDTAFSNKPIPEEERGKSKAYLRGAVSRANIEPLIKEYIQAQLGDSPQTPESVLQSAAVPAAPSGNTCGQAGVVFIVLGALAGFLLGMFSSLLVGILIGLSGICTGAILLGISALISEIRKLRETK